MYVDSGQYDEEEMLGTISARKRMEPKVVQYTIIDPLGGGSVLIHFLPFIRAIHQWTEEFKIRLVIDLHNSSVV